MGILLILNCDRCGEREEIAAEDIRAYKATNLQDYAHQPKRWKLLCSKCLNEFSNVRLEVYNAEKKLLDDYFEQTFDKQVSWKLKF